MTSTLCVELWESNEVGHKHLGGHCTLLRCVFARGVGLSWTCHEAFPTRHWKCWMYALRYDIFQRPTDYRTNEGTNDSHGNTTNPKNNYSSERNRVGQGNSTRSGSQNSTGTKEMAQENSATVRCQTFLFPSSRFACRIPFPFVGSDNTPSSQRSASGTVF
jgi:hypothetical protein